MLFQYPSGISTSDDNSELDWIRLWPSVAKVKFEEFEISPKKLWFDVE